MKFSKGNKVRVTVDINSGSEKINKGEVGEVTFLMEYTDSYKVRFSGNREAFINEIHLELA